MYLPFWIECKSQSAPRIRHDDNNIFVIQTDELRMTGGFVVFIIIICTLLYCVTRVDYNILAASGACYNIRLKLFYNYYYCTLRAIIIVNLNVWSSTHVKSISGDLSRSGWGKRKSWCARERGAHNIRVNYFSHFRLRAFCVVGKHPNLCKRRWVSDKLQFTIIWFSTGIIKPM